MTGKNVWYKLDDIAKDKVKLEDGAFVADLKDAIKNRFSNTLKGVDAPTLKIFWNGRELEGDDEVPTDTTG
jgi:hypothetical protein